MQISRIPLNWRKFWGMSKAIYVNVRCWRMSTNVTNLHTSYSLTLNMISMGLLIVNTSRFKILSIYSTAYWISRY